MKLFQLVWLILISNYSFSLASNNTAENDILQSKAITLAKSTTSLPSLEHIKEFYQKMQDDSWKHKLIKNPRGMPVSISYFLVEVINLRNDTRIEDLDRVQQSLYQDLVENFPLCIKDEKNFWDQNDISNSLTNKEIFCGKDRAHTLCLY